MCSVASEATSARISTLTTRPDGPTSVQRGALAVVAGAGADLEDRIARLSGPTARVHGLQDHDCAGLAEAELMGERRFATWVGTRTDCPSSAASSFDHDGSEVAAWLLTSSEAPLTGTSGVPCRAGCDALWPSRIPLAGTGKFSAASNCGSTVASGLTKGGVPQSAG